MNRAGDHCPLCNVEGIRAPVLRTDARKVIEIGPFGEVPMKDDDLPDIGQITTEVVGWPGESGSLDPGPREWLCHSFYEPVA